MDRVEGSLRSHALDVWRWYWARRWWLFLVGILMSSVLYAIEASMLEPLDFVSSAVRQQNITFLWVRLVVLAVRDILMVVPIIGLVVRGTTSLWRSKS